jgi:hypothetical protein
MPFTPFHMGPGAAIKALTGPHFSLTVFGIAQVAIDLEPLIRMIRGDSLLHGLSHTWLGALLIGLLVMAIGKPLGQWLLRLWNRIVSWRNYPALSLPIQISWLAAASGALLGTASHLLLDATMHGDMLPWHPFSSDNGLLYLLPMGWVYQGCFWLGVAGLVGIWLRGGSGIGKRGSLRQSS